MKLSKIALPSISFVAVGLIACGDSGTTENITNNYTTGVDVVASAADLPKCNADNAGEQYLVKDAGEFYACNGKDWKILGGSGATSVTDYGCETKPLADKRGVAIYCGGDSIGVVLNGKDGVDGKDGAQGLQGEKGDKGDTGVAGADGKDGVDGKDGAQGLQGEKGDAGSDGMPGVGCKVVSQTEDAVTIQCGDDQFSMNLNGGSGEVVVPGEDVVSLAKLNGVSQKGPFINGSTVTLFELDGSRSLVQTGRTFGGEIITDDGRFSVNNVSLKSSYVRLTANGFYRNEVTGKNSSSSIVLNAYSDLQARNSVNINLLTHLEYYRVGYLMENGLESTIKASKKRAQKEIFAAFGIDNDGFGYSEDLDVFGEGDQNAALLAMSILLQGERSEADLSALLASFGKDIEKDGKWDENAATRAKIADWADSVDLGLKGSLTLSKIESNVSGWGLGTVPAFQKYVRNFWYKEYGLGDCDETRKNVVVRDTNSKSAYYASTYAYAGPNDKKVRFICDEKSKLWRRATDIEKDTYKQKCSSEEVGLVISGKITATNKYYCSTEGWKSLMGDWSWEYPKEARMNPEIDYGTMTDDRDGQTYKTVIIGTQMWMAENLNYDYNEGTAKSYCYNDEDSNCKVTGRLYQWSAAMDSAAVFSDAGKGCGYGKECSPSGTIRGVCPEGWHLPSNDDWNTLWTAIGGTSTAGTKLKSASGWYSNGNGEDAYGFSVLPAGYRNHDGDFYFMGSYAYFWSSTENGGNRAFNKDFSYGYEFVRQRDSKDFGFSVRCLKDSP